MLNKSKDQSSQKQFSFDKAGDLHIYIHICVFFYTLILVVNLHIKALKSKSWKNYYFRNYFVFSVGIYEIKILF